MTELLRFDLHLHLEITQLVSEPLSFYPQRLSFLLAESHLFLHQHTTFNRDVIFRLQVVQR